MRLIQGGGFELALQQENSKPANDTSQSAEELSPKSKELFIGLVGYAGSGCSTAGKRLRAFLEDSGYTVHRVRMSELIAAQYPVEAVPKPVEGPREGELRLERAVKLQDLGDELRGKFGNFAVASLAVRKVRELRGGEGVGISKIAYIFDSIKHRGEVEFLRDVYGQAFRLIAVHCERGNRDSRLAGKKINSVKFGGAELARISSYMDRDEKDSGHGNGQQVRDAFYLADYFLANNSGDPDGAGMNIDVERFVNLILGAGLVRPTLGERAMNYAHNAALQSSCLSRQVGAILLSEDGEVIGSGSNDVPRFGGGVYQEGVQPDHRCHVWEWGDGDVKFVGCHNDRRKDGLRESIAEWLAAEFSDKLAELAHKKPAVGSDVAQKERERTEIDFKKFFLEASKSYGGMPGIKDLIEFSRAIHAEMNAIMSAARSAKSPIRGSLYCTTYPCHSCARHLVNAGVSRVYYVEPYVKSLALELHEDAISNVEPARGVAQQKMLVLPFTGVGPRMYEDFFTKRVALKKGGGVYLPPEASVPSQSVRLRELASIEERAAGMIPGA